MHSTHRVMEKNVSEQAFPGFKKEWIDKFDGSHGSEPRYKRVQENVPFEGMTLRQYYAAQVLPELVHVFALAAMKTGKHLGREETVKTALAYADELMKQESESACKGVL